MANEEQRVRDAARELNEAIVDARAAGFRVDWPILSDGLSTIAISAGRKALTPDEIGQAAKAEAEREQAGQAGIKAGPRPAVIEPVKPFASFKPAE